MPYHIIDSSNCVIFVVMGSAYENASNTSGVISYEPGLSIAMTAFGIPPMRCVVAMWGMRAWEGSKLAAAAGVGAGGGGGWKGVYSGRTPIEGIMGSGPMGGVGSVGSCCCCVCCWWWWRWGEGEVCVDGLEGSERSRGICCCCCCCCCWLLYNGEDVLFWREGWNGWFDCVGGSVMLMST